jgi:hypothetical protein
MGTFKQNGALSPPLNKVYLNTPMISPFHLLFYCWFERNGNMSMKVFAPCIKVQYYTGIQLAKLSKTNKLIRIEGKRDEI